MTRPSTGLDYCSFGDVAPILEHFGVDLYVPELGGRYDPTSAPHFSLMVMTGGMSKGERQRVQERVRAGMAAQVETSGRFQGGRPPYGYVTVAAGDHPNPRKAAEGFKLKKLDIDPVAAPIVRRIFDEVLSGKTVREVTRGLNADAIPCPSAHDPARNPHRPGDGWLVSTVSAILKNKRYTGYAVFGEFKKVEELIDPDDVSLGHRSKLVRSDEPAVRSNSPAHPHIVTVEEYFRAQTAVESMRSGKGGAGARKTVKHRYQGLIFCSLCGRSLSPEKTRAGLVRYRCRARDITLGAQNSHPANIRVREDAFDSKILRWLSSLFSPENLEETVLGLTTVAENQQASDPMVENLRVRLTDAKARASRLVLALETGSPPDLISPRLKDVSAEVDQLSSQLLVAESRLTNSATSAKELRDFLYSMSDIADEVLGRDADSKQVNTFLKAIGLKLLLDAEKSQLAVEVVPQNAATLTANSEGGQSVRVRRGT